MKLVVNELMRSNREFIERERARLAKEELDRAAVALGDVVVNHDISMRLHAKARTYLHAASAQTVESNELSESSDKCIVITKLLNAVCTEIAQECMYANRYSNPPTTEPVHEPDCHNDQADLFASFETSKRAEFDEEFDKFHSKCMKHGVRPNEAFFSSLNESGDRDSVPPNLALCGAKPPGSSSMLASATCNH